MSGSWAEAYLKCDPCHIFLISHLLIVAEEARVSVLSFPVFTRAFDFSVVFCVSHFQYSQIQHSQIPAWHVHVKLCVECLLFSSGLCSWRSKLLCSFHLIPDSGLLWIKAWMEHYFLLLSSPLFWLPEFFFVFCTLWHLHFESWTPKYFLYFENFL